MKDRTNYILAIGIDKYKLGDWDNLNNPVQDTRALVEVLIKNYSFELIQDSLFNEHATKENILQSLTNIIPIITEEDNLIIYFGGHGFMHPMTQKGYWIPHEARKNTADFISNSEIKDFIENIPAKHIFLIADACFSGTFLTQTRGGIFERSYSSLDGKLSRWMLASGGEETVSDGAAGKGSPFSRFLLKFLTSNTNKCTSVLEIIRYVSVLTSHHSKQHPKGAHINNIGHDGGEMVLVLRNDLVRTIKTTTNGQPQTEELAREMRSVYRRRSKLSAGKEIFLVDSFANSDHLLIWECFRFDDKEEKKIKFQGNKVKLPTKDDPNFEMVLHGRFATWEGFSRYWDENMQVYDGRKVIILNASEEIDSVEETPSAIHQQEIMQDMFDANEEPMRCLHCNNMISTNESYMVELDEIGLNEKVGNVHAKCLRPADRILGKTIFEHIEASNLVNFDHIKWLELLRSGQAFLSNAKNAAAPQKVFVLSWNRQHNFNTGEYCLSMILEDGSSRFVRLGKEIQRFPASEIDKEVSEFNTSLREAEKSGNPMGFTSISQVFGSFSQLQKSKSSGENILKVLNYEKAQYSHQIDSINKNIQNDYTPLGLLFYPGTDGFVSFGKYISLISDVTKFEKMFKNWNDVGYETEKCALKIIENDKELDLFLMAFFADGIQPVIDPCFDEHMQLKEGILIKDFEELKKEATEHSFLLNPDGVWKAGDRVKVVFPEVKADKHARGILLTDEFNDESNEPCVFFQPIEDGALREDLKFKMPVKLLVRD